MKFQSKWTLMRILAGLMAAGLLSFLIPSCTPFSSDDPNPVLDLQFDAQNDSILTCDTLIVKVYSKDSSFVQEVFHGKPDDARKLKGIQLDPRVGKQFQVSITGYKANKVTVSKEVTVLGPNLSESKNLPIKDTTPINGTQPTLQFTVDTSITEGEALRVKVAVLNPWTVSPVFGLVGAPVGASIDSTGLLTWKPDSTQGRAERYTFTITYSSEGKKVEHGISILVRNLNRPPRITPIMDKKGKANELLTFKVEATDPDMDSIQLTATSLPSGASFVNGTFSWTPSESQTGNYSARFKAFDGNDSDIASALLTIGNVDVPPPLTLEIVSPSKDTLVNTPSLQVTYLVNSTTIKRTVQLKDGRTRVYIDTTVQGRTAFDTVWVTLDTVPPAKPRVSGNSPINSLNPIWHWGGTGGGNGTFRYRLDVNDLSAAAPLKDTSVNWPKDLEPGTHTLFVQERDDAGNWSQSGQFATRIDTTRPAAPTVTVSVGSPTANTLPTWTWTSVGSDLSGNYRFNLDVSDLKSGVTVTRSSTFTPSKGQELKEGSHTLYVQVQDSAGNWSNTGSATVRVDLTPPAAPIFDTLPKSPLNSLKPTWIWKTGGQGGSGNFRCKLEDSTMDNGATTVNDTRFTPSGNLTEGAHTLYVQERDSAGNWSRTSSRTLILAVRGPIGKAAIAFGYGCYYPSLVLTADDVPFVAFEETDDLDERTNASVMRWSGTAWSYVGSRRFSDGYYAEHISLSLSKSGVPFVAFRDEGITVMRWDGVSWGYIGGRKASSADYPSLVVSGTGEPYLASGGSVIRWNSSAWVSVGDSVFGAGGISQPSLAIDGNGTPILAFGDMSKGNKASVVKQAGSTWTNVGKAGLSTDAVDFPSLALADDGVPYLAFIDIANGRKVTVMKWNGSSWELVGKAGFSIGEIGAPSLKISHAGIPYVAYADGANSGKLTVARWNGVSWEAVGGAGFTDGAVDTPSLWMSSLGVPFIAYRDVTRNNVTVIKASFDP